MNLAVRPKVMVSITRSSAVRWQQVRTRRSDTASRDGDRPCSGFPRLHRPGDATQRGCQAPFSQHIGHQNALPPPRCCQCMRLITRKVLLDLTVSAAEEKTNATHVFQPACTLRQRGLRPQGISPHTARPLLAAPHRTAPRPLPLAPQPAERHGASSSQPSPYPAGTEARVSPGSPPASRPAAQGEGFDANTCAVLPLRAPRSGARRGAAARRPPGPYRRLQAMLAERHRPARFWFGPLRREGRSMQSSYNLLYQIFN